VRVGLLLSVKHAPVDFIDRSFYTPLFLNQISNMSKDSKKMVLIGCEFSGVVRRAMRARGHDAWSCDLLPAEDNSPHHIQGDIIQVLRESPIGFWDLIVLHPPCTALALSGNSTYGRGMAKHRERIKSVR
jgi:hypothetical protein